MPIYEYRCESCGHQFEVMQKMSETPLAECPSCHKSELKKLISAGGFQLKGDGWYATDFKNGSKPEKQGPQGGGCGGGGCGGGGCGGGH